jgi:photosystem II stability/assembly factor-like uncharacterized protein
MKALLPIILCFLLLNQKSISQWHWQHPIPTGNTLNDIHMFDENTAVAVGDVGTIIKSTDGGTTWGCIFSGTTNNLHSSHFVDSNTGWAVGDSGTILKTTDGGIIWSAQNVSTSAPLNGILYRCKLGWTVGGAVGNDTSWQIFHTTDGGLNQTQQSSGTEYVHFGFITK